MASESAIIIPAPETEELVNPLRWQYDSAARLGVPAHITALYPFLPIPIAPGVIEDLRVVSEGVETFPFSFTEVRRFPGMVYLHPEEPGNFVRIMQALMKLWPDCKPYGGAHPDLIPHLTVAQGVDVETLEDIEQRLRPNLPIRCVAKELWLLTSDNAGVWSKRAVLPFASAKELGAEANAFCL